MSYETLGSVPAMIFRPGNALLELFTGPRYKKPKFRPERKAGPCSMCLNGPSRDLNVPRTNVDFIDNRPVGDQPFCHWRFRRDRQREYIIWIPHSDSESLGQEAEEFSKKLDKQVTTFPPCRSKPYNENQRGTSVEHNGGLLWERRTLYDCEPKMVETAMLEATVPQAPIRCLSDEEIVDMLIDETINGPKTA